MKNHLRITTYSLFVFCLLIGKINYLKAQSGSLDFTFGPGGAFTNAVYGYLFAYAKSVAIQTDGKIVIAGYVHNFTDTNMVVARYNVNGEPDSSFNGNGKSIYTFGTANDVANAIAIQADGKIVVGGFTSNGINADFELLRFNSDGNLDSSFGVNGRVVTDFGSSFDYGNSIAIQNEGKILMAGSSKNTNIDFAIARYNTDGSLDTTFDLDGKTTNDIGLGDNYINSMLIQPDGKLVAGGMAIGSSINYHDFAIARYNTNGSLDTSFDNDGYKFVDIYNHYDIINSIALQNDGKIVAAGNSDSPLMLNASDFALVRLNPNGSIDSTFNGNGIVTTDFANDIDIAYSVNIQSNGNIIACGTVTNTFPFSQGDFGLARYTGSGQLDTNFDGDGKVSTNYTFNTDAFSAALQSNTQIVLVGHSTNFSPSELALARYNLCSSTNTSQSITVCNGQSIVVGNHTYTTTGIYIDSFLSVNGCDSLITTNLNVLSPLSTSSTITLCAGQSYSIGASTYSVSGNYTDTFTALTTGCVSTIHTQLIILPYNFSNNTYTICSGESITVGSHTYNMSGNYIDTFMATNNCDSIVSTHLYVNPYPQITTSFNGFEIIADQNGAIYQWINCDSNNQAISGATYQVYEPIVNGNYAVVINLNGCIDTSDCMTYIPMSLINEQIQRTSIDVYPNPFKDFTLIKSSKELKNASFKLYNEFGQVVDLVNNISGFEFTYQRRQLHQGYYYFEIFHDKTIISTNKIFITD